MNVIMCNSFFVNSDFKFLCESIESDIDFLAVK